MSDRPSSLASEDLYLHACRRHASSSLREVASDTAVLDRFFLVFSFLPALRLKVAFLFAIIAIFSLGRTCSGGMPPGAIIARRVLLLIPRLRSRSRSLTPGVASATASAAASNVRATATTCGCRMNCALSFFPDNLRRVLFSDLQCGTLLLDVLQRCWLFRR